MPTLQLGSHATYDFDTHRIVGDLDLRAFATALDAVPRFAGWPCRRISVLMHEIMTAETILSAYAHGVVIGSHAARMALTGLSHDHHEVITGDIPTPVQLAINNENAGARNAVHVVQARAQHAILTSLQIAHLVSLHDDETVRLRAGGNVFLVAAVDRAQLEAEFENAFGRPYVPACAHPELLLHAQHSVRSIIDCAFLTAPGYYVERFVLLHRRLAQLAALASPTAP